jgi:dTDP-6-deoxy-L-talose 4-dehydrogenase (NAD+)
MVTGATGFIGQHLVPILLERGHEVLAVSRDEAKARKFDWFPRVHFIPTDIYMPTAQPKALFGAQDALVHLAWPGLPNYKSLFHFEHNLPADYRFLKSMIEAGVGQILVTGTCFEYGMQSGLLHEELPPNPTNPYGLAKNCLRQFLESLRQEQHFALQWARLFYMHGPGQNPGSLIAQLDRAIDRGDREFPMSGGEQLRDYLPVQTVAAHLTTLLEHPTTHTVVNICSGQPISVRRLVERRLTERNAQMDLKLGHFPYPDYEPLAFWGDAKRLRALLKEVK